MSNTLTITIRGPQGAGKSTLARALAEMFSACGMTVEVNDDGDRLQRASDKGTSSLAVKMLVNMTTGQDLKVNITTEMGYGSRTDVECETCDAPVGTPCQCAEGACPEHEDGIHCEHWWDGDGCCACAASGMTDEEKHAQGMES